MRKIPVTIITCITIFFSNCTKSSDSSSTQIKTAVGTVTSICRGCSPDYGLTPYIITMDKSMDSILVTNLPESFGVGSHLSFKYKDGDTVNTVFLPYRQYPRQATIISAKEAN